MKKYIDQKNNSLNKEIDYITKKCKENFYYSTRYKIYCYKNLLSKFNKHKSKYLDLFYYKTNSPSLDEVSPSSGNSNITKEINYSIVKECSTNTWFFVCPTLMIMYFNEDEYLEFKNSFYNSVNYKFYVIKTEYINEIDCKYIIVCTSHYKENFDYKKFLINHKCEIFYFILSNVLNSFIIMNSGISNSLNSKKSSLNFLNIVEFIGNGPELIEITNFISIMIKIINEYNKFLPLNYLLV